MNAIFWDSNWRYNPQLMVSLVGKLARIRTGPTNMGGIKSTRNVEESFGTRNLNPQFMLIFGGYHTVLNRGMEGVALFYDKAK